MASSSPSPRHAHIAVTFGRKHLHRCSDRGVAQDGSSSAAGRDHRHHHLFHRQRHPLVAMLSPLALTALAAAAVSVALAAPGPAPGRAAGVHRPLSSDAARDALAEYAFVHPLRAVDHLLVFGDCQWRAQRRRADAR